MRVEGDRRPRHHAGDPAPRVAVHQQPERAAREGQAGNQDQVETSPQEARRAMRLESPAPPAG